MTERQDGHTHTHSPHVGFTNPSWVSSLSCALSRNIPRGWVQSSLLWPCGVSESWNKACCFTFLSPHSPPWSSRVFCNNMLGSCPTNRSWGAKIREVSPAARGFLGRAPQKSPVQTSPFKETAVNELAEVLWYTVYIFSNQLLSCWSQSSVMSPSLSLFCSPSSSSHPTPSLGTV